MSGPALRQLSRSRDFGCADVGSPSTPHWIQLAMAHPGLGLGLGLTLTD